MIGDNPETPPPDGKPAVWGMPHVASTFAWAISHGSARSHRNVQRNCEKQKQMAEALPYTEAWRLMFTLAG